jgi:broad specificity phosphatase PhoE
LVLVRHGQTAANTEQVWHGHTDTPLTATGRQQVQRLGQHFHYYLPHIDVIYGVPAKEGTHYRRAYRRDHRQIGDTGPSPDGAWGRGWGRGMGGAQLYRVVRRAVFFHGILCDEHHRAPGGESRRDVTTRFVAAVEEYRRQHRGENIVVVAHGVAIAYALAHWVEG